MVKANEKYYTVAELATIFNKSRQRIHKWIELGRFPNKTAAGRLVIIPSADVEMVKESEIKMAASKIVGLRIYIASLEMSE